MQINCLVVDDEPLSQDVIIDYVNACPELVLKGVCKDAIQAGEMLKKESIELLLLDINMPKLSGISFVKTLKEPPLFIFITAYSKYAVEGFDVEAVDYLLKPVSFERFRVAVNRVLERFSIKNGTSQSGHIMVRANKKSFKINYQDILYLEAHGDYVKFVTSERSLMVHGTLKELLQQLPEHQFERVHKSYVISLAKVDYIEGNYIKIGDYKVTVSLSYREQLMKKLG